MTRRPGTIVAMAAALSIVAAACGGGSGDRAGEVSGSLNISGSSTVEPITSLVAEKFVAQNPSVQFAVDAPGTSDGFALFCNGETDISDASRAIDEEELAECEENGIEPIEIEVALDALTVIGHPSNPLDCLAFGDLYALLGPESEGLTTWSDANALATEVGGNGNFPDQALTVVAPGEESGTYGSFIELALADLIEERGQEELLRPDYQISADDNVIVDNAEGTQGGLGFVGFSFAVNAGESVKRFAIDGGEGCVQPTEENVVNGTYPISRSLYIYVNPNKFEENPAVQAFVDFYLSDEGIASVAEVQYLPLPADRLDASRSAWQAATA